MDRHGLIQSAGMIAVPMRFLLVAALAIQPQKNDLAGAEQIRQVDRLIPAVGAVVDLSTPEAGRPCAFHAIKTVFLRSWKVLGPQLACKFQKNIGKISIPPFPVARIKNIRPKRLLISRVDNYDAAFFVLFAPFFDFFTIFVGEAGTTCDDGPFSSVIGVKKKDVPAVFKAGPAEYGDLYEKLREEAITF